jgi:hypothetical protein
MTQELVRYVLLASASAVVAGVAFEGLRRRDAARPQSNNGHCRYLAPSAFRGGEAVWLDGFDTVEEAMAGADRNVVGHTDAAAG